MSPFTVVDQDREPFAASASSPAYRTEHRLPPEAASPLSFLGHGRRRRAIICGVVSTVLSALGLLAMGLFEQYNGMLSELRADLKHFNETSSEYVKKDRMQHLLDHVHECTKELDASLAARAALDDKLKASERSKEEMLRELQQIRERLAYVEGLRAARQRPDPSADLAAQAGKRR